MSSDDKHVAAVFPNPSRLYAGVIAIIPQRIEVNLIPPFLPAMLAGPILLRHARIQRLAAPTKTKGQYASSTDAAQSPPSSASGCRAWTAVP